MGMAALLAGCGGSGSQPSPTTYVSSPSASQLLSPPSTSASASSTGAMYTMVVNLRGVDTVQGTATVTAQDGCVQPKTIGASYGPHQVTLVLNVTPAPNSPPVSLSPGDAILTVDTNTWTVASAANAPQPTTGTVSATGASSGTLSVQHMFAQSTPVGPSSDEGGTITWSCAP